MSGNQTTPSPLAVELGTRSPRVRVDCILPGPVLFPPDMPEPERAEAIRSTLVPREGKPENVAQAMLFFVQRLPPGGRRPYHLRGGQLNG